MKWTQPRPSRRNTAHSLRPLSIFLAGTLAISASGCCWKMVRDITLHMIDNADKVVVAVMLTATQQYVAAVRDLFNVCSRINTSCPPRAVSPKKLSKLPLEVDFNLLHEYIDAKGDVRVATVAPVKPEEILSEADVKALPGISEADNYKFVLAAHQDLYIYVFQIDATGEVAWQYPREIETENGLEKVNSWFDAEGVGPLPAEKVLRIPADDDLWFHLNASGRNGVENFFVVASKMRQTGLEQALEQAVQAAAKQKESNPDSFQKTVINLPLVIRPDKTGLSSGEGTPAAETRTIRTNSGAAIPYSPETFTGKASTILMGRSILHLPPASK